ncbi:MAG TPA: hypothetical protein VLM40_04245 [Gemmata sp.]|nr:hypothetical protein [Gemmata sp.]
MTTFTADEKSILASVAEYRAAGSRWSIIAWRMEMPVAAIRELVLRDRPAFRRRVQWVIRDRRMEEEAKELARLRRNLKEALTQTEERVAAEKLMTFVMRLQRAIWREDLRRLKRRLIRKRDAARVAQRDKENPCPLRPAVRMPVVQNIIEKPNDPRERPRSGKSQVKANGRPRAGAALKDRCLVTAS